MSNYCVVLTTAENDDDARELARELLEARLAACVQLLPINSMYTWKGELTTDTETLLLVKTRRDLFDQLEKKLLQIHKYDTPEIIQLPIEAGSKGYLTWIDDVT
jgi:periplasmic divalent cation tolerance protein